MSRLPVVQSVERNAPARRAVLMVNPFAGNVRRPAVARIVEHFGFEDAAILEVGRDGSARDIAARVAKDGVPLMLVAGGDGTWHQAIQSLAGTGTALGALPLGTSNDLARRLGMPPELARALAELQESRVGAIDLLRLGRDWVATVGGLGLPAHVAQTSNGLKARPWLRGPIQALGGAIYSLAAAHRILRRGPQAGNSSIRVGDAPPLYGPVSALLVGTVDRFGGGLELAPPELLQSGTFAALVVSATTRSAILDTLLRVRSGRGLNGYARRYAHLTRLTFRTDRLVGAFGDGEWLGLRHRVVIRLVPAALHVLVPALLPSARPMVRLGEAV